LVSSSSPIQTLGNTVLYRVILPRADTSQLAPPIRGSTGRARPRWGASPPTATANPSCRHSVAPKHIVNSTWQLACIGPTDRDLDRHCTRHDSSVLSVKSRRQSLLRATCGSALGLPKSLERIRPMRFQSSLSGIWLLAPVAKKSGPLQAGPLQARDPGGPKRPSLPTGDRRPEPANQLSRLAIQGGLTSKLAAATAMRMLHCCHLTGRAISFRAPPLS
jgi:hypothetical protein